MSIEYTLICDGCSRIILASGKSAAAARQEAKRHRLMFEQDGRELCWVCHDKK